MQRCTQNHVKHRCDICELSAVIPKSPHNMQFKKRAIVQFKKRGKHPRRSVTFSNVAGFSLHRY